MRCVGIVNTLKWAYRLASCFRAEGYFIRIDQIEEDYYKVYVKVKSGENRENKKRAEPPCSSKEI